MVNWNLASHEEAVAYPQRPLSYPPDAMVVPTLVISYFPGRDGWIDRRSTGDVEGRLSDLRAHVQQTTQHIVHALETGSIFHGYREPDALPCLHYQLVDWLEVLEPLPTWPKPGHAVPMTDYHAILERADIQRWVRERGVKEVWIWGYHGGVVDLWESNMAGPYGDISNSDRDPHDLPVLDRTYTVYHYNYQRGPSEAVEDHIHQIEAVLRHVDPHLFWDRFVGPTGGREARCGWAHYPPNGEHDYDWANPRQVLTDIEDWTPEGIGRQQLMSCRRWGGDSLSWFIYWMQNLPGAENGLRYRGRPLTNWWRFIGDFDAMMHQGQGLVERSPGR
jgi:hypothetical protein